MTTHYPKIMHLPEAIPDMPRLIVVAENSELRRLAKTLPRPTDTVLEIGCSFGLTTRLLAQRAARVFALDLSVECVARTQQACAEFEHVQVALFDAREIHLFPQATPHADIIFLDVGGNAPLANAQTIFQLCLQVYRPRIFVLRNEQLACRQDVIQELVSNLQQECSRPPAGLSFTGGLLAFAVLAQSASKSDRFYAVKKLKPFADHGDANARALMETLRQDPVRRIRHVASQGMF